MVMSFEDIAKVERMSEWDEDKMEYKIPSFYYKEKFVVFPKAGPQTSEFVENEKNKKFVVWKDEVDYRRASEGEGFKDLKRKPSQRDKSKDF